MKKILILAPYPLLPGGVNNYISLLIKNLNGEKFEVALLHTGKTEVYWKDILYPFLVMFQSHKLKKKIKEFNPDIIHLNPSLTFLSIIRDFLFLKIAFKNSVPTILFVGGWRKSISKKFQSVIFLRYFKKNFERATLIVVLAKEFKEELIKLGIKSEKICITSTMVESDIYLPKNKTFDKPYTILYCGNMTKYKGPFELLDAIPQVLEHEKNLSFVFMGDGSELKNLKKKTKEMGIEKYVSFKGYKSGEEKYNIFKSSHIFVLPSYTEGFPNVVLEAMAAGLPIIATPVGGLKHAIRNGKNGFLLESNPPRPEDISSMILKFLNNPNMMRQISEFNIKEAKEKYDVKKVCKQIEKIYLEINIKK